MRLEVKKQYIRRDGNFTDPLKKSIKYPGGLFDSAHGWTYNRDGSLWTGSLAQETRHDLVAEQGDTNKQAVEDLIKAVCVELQQARSSFPAFNSLHEGFSILNEEVDELWEEVKKKQSSKERPALAKKEAIQVAAMALRLILDCCEKGSPGYGK